MKHDLFAGFCRSHSGETSFVRNSAAWARLFACPALVLALLVTLLLPGRALAASWAWTQQPGRERISISLDGAGQQSSIQRNGRESIGITLDPPPTELQSAASALPQQSMFRGMELNDGVLQLNTSSSAFGFIVTPGENATLHIDVYYDPLGTRWQPDGGIAPPPPAQDIPPPPPTLSTSITPGPVAPVDPAPPVAPATTPPPTPPTSAAAPSPAGGQTVVGAAPVTPGSVGSPASANALPPGTATPPPGGVAPPAPAAQGTSNGAAPVQTIPATTPPISQTQAAGSDPATDPAVPATAATSATNAGASDVAAPPSSAAAPDLQINVNTTPPTPASTPVASATPAPPTPPAPPSGTSRPAATTPVTPPPNIASGVSPSSPSATPPPAAASTVPSGTEPPSSAPSAAATTPPPAVATAASNGSGGTQATPGTASGAAQPAPGTLDGYVFDPQSGTEQAAVAPPSIPGLSGNAPVNIIVTPPAQTPAGGAPQPPVIRLGLNQGGPESWPEEHAVSFSPTEAREVIQAAAAPPVGETPVTPSPGQIVPQDSAPQGNIVLEGDPGQVSAQTPGPASAQLSAQPSGQPQNTTDPGTAQGGDQTVNININASAPQPAASGAASPQLVIDDDLPPSAAASGNGVNVNVSPGVQTTEPAPGSVSGDASADASGTGGELNASPEVSPPAATLTDEGGDTPETDVPPGLEPIYVDEAGNIVEKPKDIPTLLQEMRENLRSSAPQNSLPQLEELKNYVLEDKDREDVLYGYMHALYDRYNPGFEEGSAELILTAANEAMNFDPHSTRAPEALSVLAWVNLALDNLEEADGYISLMRQRYHAHPNVPPGMLALGQKHMDKKEYAEAVLYFQDIIQEYPESDSAKNAARLETYALYHQGHMERALALLEFVERRWPGIYLEDPDYLTMGADIRARQGLHLEALQTYWIQYNLAPTSPSAATTLQRIAELYFTVGDKDTACRILEKLIEDFPQSEETPLAMLRLGENGMHDGALSVDEMLALFSEPNPRIPSIYYHRILNDFPDSPQAVTARLRSFVWQYWNKEYTDAMNEARSFMIDYDSRPEAELGLDVLLRAFAYELGSALGEENYERILALWDRFPQVQPYYQPLEPDLRMALARAVLNRNDEAGGLELMAPFLDDGGDPKYGFYSYTMHLANYLRNSNWDGILGLGEKVAAWNLPPDARAQLDYAMALSAENVGLHNRALPLWQKLAPMTEIPLYQRAYASYFLARNAERRQDLRDAYQYNLDTLAMFTQLNDEQSPYADSERMRESVAALMDVTEIAGRYAEALEWASRYSVFVPMDSPDYAGLRFREGGLHRKMGDMARWRAIMQSIVDSEPDSVFGKMAASELNTQNMGRDLSRFVEE